jgi:hypothetical protein
MGSPPVGLRLPLNKLQSDEQMRRMTGKVWASISEETGRRMAKFSSDKSKVSTSSKYVGVSFNEQTKKWHTEIDFMSTKRKIGVFENEVLAARAHDDALRSECEKFYRMQAMASSRGSALPTQLVVNFPQETEGHMANVTEINGVDEQSEKTNLARRHARARATSVDLEQAFMDPRFMKYLGKDDTPLKQRYAPVLNKFQAKQKEENENLIAAAGLASQPAANAKELDGFSQKMAQDYRAKPSRRVSVSTTPSDQSNKPQFLTMLRSFYNDDSEQAEVAAAERSYPRKSDVSTAKQAVFEAAQGRASSSQGRISNNEQRAFAPLLSLADGFKNTRGTGANTVMFGGMAMSPMSPMALAAKTMEAKANRKKQALVTQRIRMDQEYFRREAMRFNPAVRSVLNELWLFIDKDGSGLLSIDEWTGYTACLTWLGFVSCLLYSLCFV